MFEIGVCGCVVYWCVWFVCVCVCVLVWNIPTLAERDPLHCLWIHRLLMLSSLIRWHRDHLLAINIMLNRKQNVVEVADTFGRENTCLENTHSMQYIGIGTESSHQFSLQQNINQNKNETLPNSTSQLLLFWSHSIFLCFSNYIVFAIPFKTSHKM